MSEPNQLPIDSTARELIVSGTRLLARRQVGDAIALLEEALTHAPESFDARLNLSAAYILQKRFKDAVPVLESLSESHADNVQVWTNLGAAYLGNPVLADDARQQRAIAAFERAYALDVKAPHVAYNLGLIYRDRREAAQAIAWFERALEANPADDDARHWIEQLGRHNPQDTA